MENKSEALRSREQLILDTVALKQTDHVPFVPQIGSFYALGYGLSIQQPMDDIRVLLPVMDKYVEDYDPDMVYAPSFYPSAALEKVTPMHAGRAAIIIFRKIRLISLSIMNTWTRINMKSIFAIPPVSCSVR